jgi:bacteriocin-like protein
MSHELKKSLRRDRLTSATDESKIEFESKVELTEEELSQVTGGLLTVRKAGENPIES